MCPASGSLSGLVPSWWPVLSEAFVAVDGPALCWLEGNFTFLSAVRASRLVHLPWSTVEAAPFAVIHSFFHSLYSRPPYGARLYVVLGVFLAFKSMCVFGCFLWDFSCFLCSVWGSGVGGCLCFTFRHDDRWGEGFRGFCSKEGFFQVLLGVSSPCFLGVRRFGGECVLLLHRSVINRGRFMAFFVEKMCVLSCFSYPLFRWLVFVFL